MTFRKQIIIAHILFCISVFSGCNVPGTNQNINGTEINPPPPSDQNNPYQPRNADKPEQILIYCDLTTSIKQEGILKISEKLRQVLLGVPRGSVVNIRVVEKNLLGESPFPEISTPSPCKIPETEIKRKITDAQKECEKNDPSYIAQVEEVSEKIKTLKPQVDISCIINTLEAAHDFFMGKDKNKYKFRLIYFSDMIEQCYANSIFICGKKNQPKKLDILTKIEKGFNPTYNLESLLGEDISIIITTSDNPSYKCLSLSEQKDIWALVFSKTAYSNLDISTFNFTQEIPEELKKDNKDGQ